MRASVWAAIVAAACVPATAAAQSGNFVGCFWGNSAGYGYSNVAYPDTGATYWRAQPTIPPGAEKLVVKGTYPYARYFSINLYNEQTQPIDGLRDDQIVPDAGSENPFLPGADRFLENRDYTITIRPGVTPLDPEPADEPNTIFLTNGVGAPARTAVVLFRVYVPDAGRDLTGGVGMPTVELHLVDGTVLDLTERCNQETIGQRGRAYVADEIDAGYADGDLEAPEISGPATDPIRWEAFFNLPHKELLEATGDTAAEPSLQEAGVLDLVAETAGDGGYLSNIDNDYVGSYGHRELGPVLVLTGKAPTTPETRDDTSPDHLVMGEGQVRYWSICTNEQHSTRSVACLHDEDVLLDDDRRFTIVVSSPEDRPANATTDCGVGWLPWGASPEVMLILRHMTPAGDFAEAIQNVSIPSRSADDERPGTVRAVVGEYLPAGVHMTTEEFETLGCS